MPNVRFLIPRRVRFPRCWSGGSILAQQRLIPLGRELEISYPHGKAGIARDVAEKAASEKQTEHQHGRNEPGKDRDR